jgi:MFS family permease
MQINRNSSSSSCGAGSALISHLLEFHSAKYRARVQMLRGVFGMSFGTIILPLLGLVILPADINIEISNHFGSTTPLLKILQNLKFQFYILGMFTSSLAPYLLCSVESYLFFCQKVPSF